MLYLICRTTDHIGSYECAVLEMPPALAEELLLLRHMVNIVHKQDDQLYCIEFFNYEVEYGSSLANLCLDDDAPELNEDWYYWHSDPGLVTEGGRTTAETLKATVDGILWSASPEHSDGYFETVELSWQNLEKLARGENPCERVPVPEEEEEADAEEKDA